MSTLLPIPPITESTETCNSEKGKILLRDVLKADLLEVRNRLPSLWPLADFVAVNPFFGLTENSFLSAKQKLSKWTDVDTLMPLDYFREKIHRKEVSLADIDSALDSLRHINPEVTISLQEILDELDLVSLDSNRQAVRIHSQILAKISAVDWEATFLHEVTKYCGSFFDEGQATWKITKHNKDLYSYWRQLACLDKRLDLIGLRGFRELVDSLPTDPIDTIQLLLNRMELPQEIWGDYLTSLAFANFGWSTFCRRYDAERAAESGDTLTSLIAIRLAFDFATYEALTSHERRSLIESYQEGSDAEASWSASTSLQARFVLQNALEMRHRSQLLSNMALVQDSSPRSKESPRVQMVFCIDVRSEIYRRHLEGVSSEVETFGFAGFFGTPIKFSPSGFDHSISLCPVLLTPSIESSDTNSNHSTKCSHHDSKSRRKRMSWTNWNRFRSSAGSSFSFVELFGVSSITKLAKGAFSWSTEKTNGLTHLARQGAEESDIAITTSGLSETAKVDLAENTLRNLGLTEGFGELVVFCGHESSVTNNPYRAGYDCGACGGHTGAVNSKFIVSLLNDCTIRNQLNSRGISIPEKTWFVAAVHNTTTDEIRFFGINRVPTSHTALMSDLSDWTKSASECVRSERVSRFGMQNDREVIRRSKSWSETRPEWGLAGNRFFIAAPRAKTKDLNLRGQAFLHNYDHHSDCNGKILELILTAPVVVASWINLQYYASVVDNSKFGSGNKTLHNVVGGVAVLEGNSGDIRFGLPWQAVHDGEKLQHDPFRLTVVIEAPRSRIESIVARHQHVRDLFEKGWISLVATDKQSAWQFVCIGQWQELSHEATDAKTSTSNTSWKSSSVMS